MRIADIGRSCASTPGLGHEHGVRDGVAAVPLRVVAGDRPAALGRAVDRAGQTDGRQTERLRAPEPTAAQRVTQHGPVQARPPTADEAVAVRDRPRHPRLPFLEVAGRRLVVPQRGATVVHEPPATVAQLQAQVDVLLPVHVAGAEPADRLDRRAVDQEACGRERRHVANADGVVREGVLPRPEGHRQRRPVDHAEGDTRVLQGQVGVLRTGEGLRRPPRIDESRPDGRDVRAARAVDQPPEPAGFERLDVVVEEQHELAARRREALVVRIGERRVLVVADDPDLEPGLERGEHLERGVGRRVVDDDELDVPVGRRRQGGKEPLQQLRPIAVEHDDRHERPAGRRRRKVAQPCRGGLDELPFLVDGHRVVGGATGRRLLRGRRSPAEPATDAADLLAHVERHPHRPALLERLELVACGDQPLLDHAVALGRPDRLPGRRAAESPLPLDLAAQAFDLVLQLVDAGLWVAHVRRGHVAGTRQA